MTDCVTAGVCPPPVLAGDTVQCARTQASADICDDLDAAYRDKYRRYAASIIDHVVSPQARAAALRLVPGRVSP